MPRRGTTAPRRPRPNLGMPGEHANAYVLAPLSINPEDWPTPELANRYVELSEGKVVVPNVLPHIDTMRSLGIYEDVRGRFASVGLDCLFEHDWRTYSRIVWEFFTTFSPILHGGKCVSWRFRFGDHEFLWDKAMLHDTFGFPMDGVVPHYPRQAKTEFWQRIAQTQLDFEPSATASCIADGEWKYIHRLIATNIMARAEGGQKVQDVDMDIMIAMDRGERLDIMELLSSRFMEWLKPNSKSKGLGACFFITGIALKCQVKVSALIGYLGQSLYLDSRYLRHLKMMEDDGWVFTIYSHTNREGVRHDRREQRALEREERQREKARRAQEQLERRSRGRVSQGSSSNSGSAMRGGEMRGSQMQGLDELQSDVRTLSQNFGDFASWNQGAMQATIGHLGVDYTAPPPSFSYGGTSSARGDDHSTWPAWGRPSPYTYTDTLPTQSGIPTWGPWGQPTPQVQDEEEEFPSPPSWAQYQHPRDDNEN